MNFGFLLFEQFEDLDFFGPWEMIALWSQRFNGPDNLVLISEIKGGVDSYKGLTLQTDVDFTTCPALDYLLVPGGMGTRKEVHNPNLISFLQKHATQCKQVLSVCTGVFLLQAAKLLTGKQVTTHWNSLKRLQVFDELTVVEKRFIQQDKLWMSAGVSAGIDMTLAFIAHHDGEQTAGNIQLEAEYYPSTKVYPNDKNYYPGYLKR